MTAIIGIDPTSVQLAADVTARGADYRLGSIYTYEHPTLGTQQYIRGKAQATITGAGYAVVETSGFVFRMLSITATTPGTAGFGNRVGVAMAASAVNDHAWFQIYGKGTVRTLASAAAGTRLNSTGTNGCVDDDATAGSEAIVGLTLGTATGGAEANNSDAYLCYPNVGFTI